MKKLTLIFAAILALGSLNARAQISKTRVGEDTIKLDKVNYRITYQAKQVNDTTQHPYIYQQAEMRLDIGNMVTYFYNYSHNLWTKQVMNMMLSSNTINLRQARPIKCMAWEFLKNYPKEGETTFQESWGITTYHCIEKIEISNWELIPDSTSSILGYNCQLAKANFKGRTWYAWYSEDIPISEGPWKLYGLPGLILRAYDSQQQFYLNAIGLQDLKGKEDLKYAKPDKTEKISQADLTKVKLRDDMGEMLRASAIKISDGNGKAIKLKSRKRVFNPIER